jgi:HTH-type transcriptional regulator / antitoxin HigA
MTIKIKKINTKEDHEEALKLIQELMNANPNPESEDGEKLALLTTLVSDYESRNFPKNLPNPIDAILFRMEQNNLTPNDLVSYIGSRSRVSEILSGKRQLTLEMVRSLEAGLGIPSKVLIQKSGTGKEFDYQNWDDHLVAEMNRRGYFGSSAFKKHSKEELLNTFFGQFGSQLQFTGMLRKSNYRSSPLTDKRALSAWAACIIKKAQKINCSKKYKHGAVNQIFMQELVKLSIQEKNPLRAQEYLKEHGIILVVEPHFAKTYLDGATILSDKDHPIIGLTLRFDRLDNFWFTLMHELAHISLHYNSDINLFYDELEGIKTINLDDKEQEADKLAEEILLPNAKWEVSPARLIPSPMAANSLAKELGVHTAIIAGQIRHKGNKYVYLSKIVNESKVRYCFPHEKWNK